MDNLSHIIYSSQAVKVFSDQELIEMLKGFRKNNQSLDVTGMLLYDDDVFFQVIEGDETVIAQLYDAIKIDPRHRLVTTLVNEAIAHKDFRDWSMGFYKVDQQQLNNLEGINDFFTKKECLSQVDLGIAKKLLQIFSAKHAKY